MSWLRTTMRRVFAEPLWVLATRRALSFRATAPRLGLEEFYDTRNRSTIREEPVAGRSWSGASKINPSQAAVISGAWDASSRRGDDADDGAHDFKNKIHVVENGCTRIEKIRSGAELRRKSFEDLHKLWYVLYKERNVLLTESRRARRHNMRIKNPLRRTLVRKSMAGIKQVLSERRKAYRESLPNGGRRHPEEERITFDYDGP